MIIIRENHIKYRLLVSLIVCMLYGSRLFALNTDSLLASHAPDSVKATLLGNHAFELNSSDPGKALQLARQALLLAQNCGCSGCYASCLNCVGWTWYCSGNDDSAKYYLSKAQAAFHELNGITGEARAMINMANIYDQESDLNNAMHYLLSSIQLTGSEKGVEYAVAEKLLGIIYRKQGYNDKALLYLRHAVADFSRLGKNIYMADAISSLGGVYYNLNHFDSAILYYYRALNIDLSEHNLPRAALQYGNLGAAFQKKGNSGQKRWLDSALVYFRHASDLYRSLKDEKNMHYEQFSIGEVLHYKKENRLAEKYILQALQWFQSAHDIEYLPIAYALLSQINGETHNYKEGYEYLLKANAYNDTLSRLTRDKDIADMLVKYEADKKDSTIALLNVQNKLLDAKRQLAEHDLNRRRIIELFSLVLIVLVVLIAILLLNRYRINQKLRETLMRNRISHDLHDDVGSSLSSILLLSKIAHGQEHHQPELIERISNTAAEVIERISDIIWFTNPRYDDGENFRAKIMNYLVFLHQMPEISTTVNIADNMRTLKLNTEMRRNIFLIIKEAINNILKHAQASEIKIDVHVQGNNVLVEIADNGRGFDTVVTHSGNGLGTMNTRALAAGGSFEYKTAIGAGTRISVIIPVPRSYINKRTTLLHGKHRA